jgi:uncharacterized cupredoxin-like copper-binding protein
MKRLAFVAALFVAIAVALLAGGCSNGSSGGGPSGAGADHPADISEHDIPSVHDVDPPYEAEDLQATTEARDAGVPSARVTTKDMKFTPDRIQLPAGERVIITLQNADGVEHDLQVDGLKVEPLDEMDRPGEHDGAGSSTLALHTKPNGTARLTFRAEQKGTFAFHCTIPSHREAGMIGTLTIT